MRAVSAAVQQTCDGLELQDERRIQHLILRVAPVLAQLRAPLGVVAKVDFDSDVCNRLVVL